MEILTPTKPVTSRRQHTDPTSWFTPSKPEVSLTDRRYTPLMDSLELDVPGVKKCQKFLSFEEPSPPILQSVLKQEHAPLPPEEVRRVSQARKRVSFNPNSKVQISQCTSSQDSHLYGSSIEEMPKVVYQSSPRQKSGRTTSASTARNSTAGERMVTVITSSDGSYQRNLAECSDNLEELVSSVSRKEEIKEFQYEKEVKVSGELEIGYSDTPCVAFCNNCSRQIVTQVLFESEGANNFRRVFGLFICCKPSFWFQNVQIVHRCTGCQYVLARFNL